jgi:hypothetical protein
MKKPGIMSGKVFKGTNPYNDGVQYGPNTHQQEKHPVDKLLDATMGIGKIPYEPNGLVQLDPTKIEYLKS